MIKEKKNNLKKKSNEKPLISFITPMKEKDFRVIRLIKSVANQNYPKDKIELIITDGGSNPKVLEECRKYDFVKIYNNPKGFAEGAGMGKDQGIWKSKGKYIVIAESDIEFMDQDWINNMIKPLEEDTDIFASVPKLHIEKSESLTNRYLSYVGVDPFASYRALEGNLEFNRHMKKIEKEGYILLALDKKEPYCMGSNGFMFRKSIINEVGDYAQDVEFIGRIAKKGYSKFAFVPEAKVWHKNVKGLNDFIKKRIKWTKNYSKVYINEKKDFNWITDRSEFLIYIIKNMLFLPNIPMGIKKSIEYKDSSWLLHPFMMLFSTSLNIYYSLTSRKMLKQVFNN
jgi:GT2 family glycosyltransferase